MKILSNLQYDWLCAVGRGDYLVAAEIANHHLPDDKALYDRGLYSCTDDPVDNHFMIIDSVRLTQAGRDAIMCYRAIMQDISF